MKKILHIPFLIALVISLFLISSCSSMQHDIIIYTQEEMDEIKDIELAVCSLDVDYYLNQTNDKDFAKNCNSILNSINYSVKYMGQNNALRARLYALQGRVYLLQNKASKARESYDQSVKTFKGETQSLILGFRLGLIEDIEDKNVTSVTNEKHLLVLEKALDYYSKGQYKYSAAYFDKAFLEMDQDFVNCYMSLRNSSWKLKEVEGLTSDKNVVSIINKDSINTEELLLLTQETSSLLLKYNQGKKLKEDSLYKLCVQNNLLTSISGEDQELTALKTQEVTKLVCARYLWNLLNDENQSEVYTKYSKLFRSSNRKSPIADIDLSNPDFDAVLGCVENEIINLTDGKSFNGNDIVAGYDAYLWIKKAEAKANQQ